MTTNKQNLGYACINMHLSEGPAKSKVGTNRGMIKKTFFEKGIDYASEISLLNVRDIIKILQWNTEHGIKMFRLSSDIFPWASEYDIRKLKDFKLIREELEIVGRYATKNNIRLSFHPGPYNVLASDKQHVVKNTITDLENHSLIFDLMGFSPSLHNKINIHLGFGSKPEDKQRAYDNFCKNFEFLSPNLQARLTTENDDRENMHSVRALFENIYKRIGTAIVFDYHHHRFCDDGLTEKEALCLAVKTWGNVKPTVHYSESKSEEQNIACKPQAHSDYVKQYIDQYGNDVDIMIEAKQKEKAVLLYRKIHES